VSGRLIGFPNPVDERAARTVAGVVMVASAALLVLSGAAGHAWLWGTTVLAYGFVARVLSGPTLSPLGRFAVSVVAPRLGEPRLVAGPPKRFAQAIGAAVTLLAVVLFVLGHPLGAQILLGVMIVAAGLESIFGYCIGCKVFAGLMRLGLIPEETCEACNNLALRTPSVVERA